MKTPILALAGISLLAGTAALAQPGDRNPGPMTRAEVSQKAAERFQKMDLNSDGVLDLADRELRREQRIARLDTDGNNAISKAEREAAREARQERRAQRMAERGQSADAGERRGRGKHHRGMRGWHRGGGGWGIISGGPLSLCRAASCGVSIPCNHSGSVGLSGL